MQALLEYLPWIVFGLVFAISKNIYLATGTLMGVMTLLLAYYWLSTRKIPRLHLALTIMVLVFGGATLIFHDVRFLQWKASIVYWVIGILFAGSVWVGEKTLLERMMGAALPEGVTVPSSSWRNGSLLLGAFNVLLGFVNIWVARTHTQEEWAFFKVWIALPVALIFTVGVVLYLMRDVIKRESAP
jgi:intracellular septation protein